MLHPDVSCDNLVSKELQDAAKEYIVAMEEKMDPTAVKKINQHAKAYAKVVNELEINPDDEEFLFNNKISKEVIKKIDSILHNIITVAQGIAEYADFESVNKTFKKHMNETSLVVHNESLLLAGDVTSRVVASLHRSGAFHESYKAIKLPHHGSNSHFSMNLPYADFLLACSDSVKWDIKEDNQYLNTLLKSMTIFSNGDVFHNGHIFHTFYDGQIKINL